MSIMKRVRDLTIATLNERLERAEDPVRLIDSYLAEQREQIRQAEALYRQVAAHAEAMRRQYTSAEQLKEKREQQAMLALKAGEEHVARLALQEKAVQEEKSAKYKVLYEQSRNSMLELEEQLEQWKADYREAAEKRQYYAARMESVRLQQKLNEQFGGTGAYSVPRMFQRLEDRVSDLELEARALRDVRRTGYETFGGAASGLQQTLEAELQRFKNKLEQEGWLHR